MAFIDKSRLEDHIQLELEKANLISAKKILSYSPLELKNICNLTTQQINTVQVLAASTHLASKSFTRVSNSQDLIERRITINCPQIDSILGGGLRVKGITELAGESGVGKTQICLQFSLTVQYCMDLGGLGKGAVFICTEDKFPSNRLHQLLKSFPFKKGLQDLANKLTPADRIFIDHVADVEGLKECVYSRLPKLLDQSPIGIIIIDSIAAAFRAEYSLKDSVRRAKDLRDIGIQLHKLNSKYQVAVLCVNQVADVMDSSGIKVPALGLAWANTITTRLHAYREANGRRYLQMVSAPDLPQDGCFYEITDSGVNAVMAQ